MESNAKGVQPMLMMYVQAKPSYQYYYGEYINIHRCAIFRIMAFLEVLFVALRGTRRKLHKILKVISENRQLSAQQPQGLFRVVSHAAFLS